MDAVHKTSTEDVARPVAMLNYWETDIDTRVLVALRAARDRRIAQPKDPIVVVTGHRSGTGNTNMLRLVYCPDDRDTVDGAGFLHMPKIDMYTRRGRGSGLGGKGKGRGY